MPEDSKYEKQPPTAPPPYSVLYPTGASQPDAPQYGFQPPPPQAPQPYNPGYPPPPQPLYPGYPPSTQSTTIITQPTVVTQPPVVVMGGCPACRVGVLEDSFTCCGILCAICFFPIGILCCLCMKEKKCTNCNATF